jgi:hypothetical protein
MKGINCKHCFEKCKTQGKTECSKYKAKANRPNDLKTLINKAILEGNLDLVKEYQNELNEFYYGKQ